MAQAIMIHDAQRERNAIRYGQRSAQRPPPTSHDVRGIAVVRPLSLNSFVTQGRKAVMRGLASSMVSHLGVGTHAVRMAALLDARQTCGYDASRCCSCPQR